MSTQIKYNVNNGFFETLKRILQLKKKKKYNSESRTVQHTDYHRGRKPFGPQMIWRSRVC